MVGGDEGKGLGFLKVRKRVSHDLGLVSQAGWFEDEDCGGWKPPLLFVTHCLGFSDSFPRGTRALACGEACQWHTNLRTFTGLDVPEMQGAQTE